MNWSVLARTYDRQLFLERTALRAAVDIGAPRREDAWLDLGTGTGGMLRELANRPQRPSVAVGIDESRSMLSQVPALPAGWELEAGDARRLRFPAESFTVVSAAYLLHIVNAGARAEILAEAHRVLRAAGRIVLVTPALPRSPKASTLYTVLARAVGAVSGAENPLGPLDPRDALRATGFTVESARHVTGGYPSLCVSATRGT